VLPGDGIGPEVIDAALKVLPGGLDLVHIDAGAERWLRSGQAFGDDDLDVIKSCDALLMGAVGDPRVPDGILERGIIIRLRQELDLYVNLRPFPELGITIVRENTEGPYSGVGGRDGDTATEVNVNTVPGVRRCVRYAFELAKERAERLTLVHKTNVLVHAGALWREVTDDMASSFPDVPVDYAHADAAAYHLVREPGRYDVIVTDNLFGDLLSDLAAGLAGGLGAAASANLHPEPATRSTRCLGLFEPVHGTAPDIAGKGLADSAGAVTAARMLVDALEAEPATA